MKLLPKFIRHAFDKVYTYTLIKASGLFDEDWYAKSYYEEMQSSGLSPLKHFIKIGYKKGYNPSPKFSCTRYLAAYPMIHGVNPLIHYLKRGRFHGYKCYAICGEGQKKIHESSEKPLISVVVTSYNYAQYITQTLNSVLSQTYDNFEIIVVDDGSKDNSVQIISEYVKRHDNVRLYMHPNKENKGLIASMQLGIEKSEGQYIAFCESDDYWTKEHLEKKVQMINQYENVTIISNDIELIGNEIDIEQRREYFMSLTQLLRNGGNKIDIKHFQERNWIPTLSAVMIKTDVLKKLNFDSPVPAWVDFWLYRQILKDNLLFYVDAKLTFWRQHESYNGARVVQLSEVQMNNAIFVPASNKLIGIRTKRIKAPRCIRKSHLFNKKYYKAQVKNCKDIQSLAYHYYTIGWRQGLNPSKNFDGDAYLSLNTDLISASLCPLYHYELIGKSERRQYVSVDESEKNSIKYEDIDNIKLIRKQHKVALLVSHELSLTGAPRALLKLAQSLKRCEVYPVIVSPKDGELRKEIEENGIECKIINAMVSHVKSINISRIQFSEYVKEFDYVFLNTLVMIPIVKSLAKIDIKKICWIHEGMAEFDKAIYNGYLSSYLSVCDKVCVVGDYVNEILQKRTEHKIPASIFLYGIEDTSQYVATDKFNKNLKVRMAIAGTIDNRKGHDILVESIRLIPVDIKKRLEIFIIGRSVDKRLVSKIENCRDVDFKIMGEVEHQKLLEIMASIDVLLCPSRDDPMPIVCTEAMMLSKPLIVSTQTGTYSFIHDGVDGFIFESGNPELLADAIVRAVNKLQDLPEMGKRARKIYEEYFDLEQFDKNVKHLLS